MAEASRQIRKIDAGTPAEIDEQIWPVHCAILVLAGCVGGVIYALSDFHDPRWLYNGWVHLGALAVALLVLLVGAIGLRDRILRRLQFGLIVSLILHLLVALYLHQQHLTVLAFNTDQAAEPAAEAPPVEMPEYHFQYYDNPAAEQVFERPVETAIPDAPETTPTHSREAERDIPLDERPVDHAVPRRQQPNPLEMARRELSAPRRSSDQALRPLSRQSQRDAPVPDQPIDQPQAVSRSRNLDLSFNGATTATPRRNSDLPLDSRLTLQDPSDRRPRDLLQPLRQQPKAAPDSAAPATPSPTRTMTDLAAEASTPAAVPAPAPVAERPQQLESPGQMSARSEADLPQARRQAAEPTLAPTPQSAMARADARPVRQQPQLADIPRAEASRQARTLDVPSATAEPAPELAAATPQLRTVLRPNTTPAPRAQAAQPTRSSSPASASPHAPAAAALAVNTPSRAERSETASPAARSEISGQIARQSPSALSLENLGQEAVAEDQPAAAPASVPSPALAEPDRLAVARSAARPQGSQPGQPGQPGQEVAADAPAVQIPTSLGRRAEGARQHLPTPATSEGSPTVVARSVPGISLEAEEIAHADGGSPSDGMAQNLPGPSVSGLAAETGRSAPAGWITDPTNASGAPGSTAGGTGGSPSAAALAGGPRLAATDRGQTPPSLSAGGEGTVLPRGIGSPSLGSLVSGEVAESTPEAPSSGSAMPAGTPALSMADVGPARTAPGLPGSAGEHAPLEGVDRIGPLASTPGLAIGPRRLAGGEGQGPEIAADMGSGPPRQSLVPGLPVDLGEPGESSAPALAMNEPGFGGDLGTGPVLGEPSRTSGGLPVFNRADPGPGGMDRTPSPTVGILDRRARPESESVHSVSRRFVLDRAGGELAIDGKIHEEPMAAFKNRDPGERQMVARERGGTAGTEQAVELGLDFLARHQFPDGHWSLERLPHGGPGYEDVALGTMHSDTAATGLALLSFLGAGYTHQEDKHRMVVRRAIEWLATQQKPTGDLFAGGSEYTWFYSHGIAAIALCEAYGMTRDKALRDPAQRAIQFIVDAQHPQRGGWRYAPRSESDTSVTGWQLMAMQSARMAGLDVPDDALNRVGHWLDLARVSEGRYMYNPNAGNSPAQRAGKQASPAMSAEALLMRMYLGWDRTHPELIQGVEYLRGELPEVGTAAQPTRDAYYWYYATQVMFHMQGDAWEAWNGRLRPLLQNSQIQQGPLAGSWHPLKPIRDRWGEAGGRMYVTAMHLLMLEVYYRHLPLYEELK